MKPFYKILATALILLLTYSLSAQSTYTIQATILDSVSRTKLPFVSVGIMTSDSTHKMFGGAVSDNRGNFFISGIPAGKYLIKCNLLGYDLRTIDVTIGGENKTIRLQPIVLKKMSTTLREVSIVTEKPIFLVEGEKTMYNVAEDPTIQSGTASDALQNTPGVEVDIEGNITLHGASSVDIWINDRPSNLTEDNLKSFIQQLPANALDRIEVINNPSAKYNTEADAIINIMLAGNIKKNSFISFGITGSSKPEVNPWISYVWANKKLSLNLYLNGRYTFQNSISESEVTRFNANMDTASYGRECGQSISNKYSTGFNVNGSYIMDTANNISFWAGTYPSWGHFTNNQNNFRIEYLDAADIYAYINDNTNRNFSAGAYGGLWYKHNFNQPGHELKVSINGNYNSNKSNAQNFRDYILQNDMDWFKKGLNSGSSYSIRSGIDYTLPYSKNGEFSAGVDGRYSSNRGLSSFDTLVAGTDDLFLIDSLRLKDTYNQNGGLSVFTTLQHKFGKFTIKGGVRARYNHEIYQILNSPKDNVITDRWNVFPSLHLSYRTKNMHNFRFSYTYRINEPSASRLSTFISYNDDSFSTGNPELLPTHTNNIEFNWTKFYNKFGNVGLTAYFKNTNKSVSTLNDVAYDEHFGRIVNFSMPVNAGQTINTGASANINYRLKTFMTIRFYASVYYKHAKYQFRNEVDPRIFSNVGYSFRLNYWAKVWKVLEIFASANYRSKNVTLFTTTKPYYSIDCGLRADILDRKLSLYLNVADIFNWNKSATQETNPYYQSTSSTKYNSRFISAGITLRFGKMELEKKASTGSDIPVEEED